jgi:hypothetical protein
MRQSPLAILNHVAPRVEAVDLQQVEGMERNLAVLVHITHAVGVAADNLADTSLSAAFRLLRLCAENGSSSLRRDG